MEERFSHYKLVKAKNGATVPYINEVYLHSMYDPYKEAQGFSKLHEQTLATKKNIIVLGLGFGYHIKEIAKTLGTHHDRYKVIVIEPNERLYKDFTQSEGFTNPNIIALHTKSIDNLFRRRDFIEFLLQRPAIIKHDASFVLNRDFYTGLLKHKAHEEISTFENYSDHYGRFVAPESEMTLGDEINSLTKKKRLDKRDLLLLAFNETLRNTTVESAQ